MLGSHCSSVTNECRQKDNARSAQSGCIDCSAGLEEGLTPETGWWCPGSPSLHGRLDCERSVAWNMLPSWHYPAVVIIFDERTLVLPCVTRVTGQGSGRTIAELYGLR